MAAIVILVGSGCSRPQENPAELGVVTFALSLPSGASINSVHYDIHSAQPTTPPADAQGNIDTSNNAATPSVERNFPASTNDTVTLSATTTNGEPCTGTSSQFAVLSGQQSVVGVTLTCGLLTPDGGAATVRINGTVVDDTDICPVITNWMASPLSVPVGAAINVSATATDANVGDSVSYAWSSNDGAPVTATAPFANKSAATTQYTCPSGGTFTLTLTVTDNHATPCSVHRDIMVTCVAVGLVCPTSVPGVWADLSGNGHDATLKNFGTGSGLVGSGVPADPYAMQFDGVDDYAELAAGADGLRLTNEVTLEIWVNDFFAEGVGSYNLMYTNRNGAETSGVFGGIINPGNINNSQWILGYGIGATSWAQPFLYAPGLPPSNTWTHYVGTFSVSQGFSRLYINGVQVDSSPMTAPIFYSAPAVPRVGGEVGTSNFRGKFGEIRIWAAALDANEVLARYEAGAPTYGIVAPSPTLSVTKPVALRLDAVCH